MDLGGTLSASRRRRLKLAEISEEVKRNRESRKGSDVADEPGRRADRYARLDQITPVRGSLNVNHHHGRFSPSKAESRTGQCSCE